MMEHITKEEYLRLLKKKQVKYRNKKTDTGRGLFASKKEAAFERECFLRLKAGEIKDYAVQVRIPLDVNGVHICFYIADFVIRHNDDGIVNLINPVDEFSPLFYHLWEK